MGMDEYGSWVESLDVRGEHPTRQEAVLALRQAGEAAKPALLAGLGHPAWRVRHGCLRVLDHSVVDDDTRRHVVRSLADPHRKVRMAAMHVLGCEVCKPEGFCGLEGVDVDGIYLELVRSDPSLRVRRTAVARFMWSTEPLEDRVRSLMTEVMSSDTDPEMRRRALFVLAWEEAFADGPERKVGISRFRALLQAA